MGHVWCKRHAKNRLDIIVYILEKQNAKFGSEKWKSGPEKVKKAQIPIRYFAEFSRKKF